MIFARETLFDIIEDIEPLLAAHHAEVLPRPDLAPLAPQWAQYRALEQMGRYVVFTARADAALAGYAGFFLNWHLHHARLMSAVCDAIYLRPEHRRGAAGSKFIDYAERGLRSLGAGSVTFEVPLRRDWRAVLHRRGYASEAVTCSKFL